jgi:hypothetical protein
MAGELATDAITAAMMKFVLVASAYPAFPTYDFSPTFRFELRPTPVF